MEIDKVPASDLRERLWTKTVIDAMRWLQFNNIEHSMLEYENCSYADSVTITVKGFEFELTKEDIMFRADCYWQLVEKGLAKAEFDEL